ncbi:MAG: hypothetical protein JWO99_504 [Candidatus Saccharibacteria bacterium]|nr:hypothetical protein [Candidatus Saccharibacteria bacterium]
MSENKKDLSRSPKKIARADVKALLSDPKEKIALHTLVFDETEKIYDVIKGMPVGTNDIAGTAKQYIAKYDEATKDLSVLLGYGVYFGTEAQDYLWTGIINTLVEKPENAGSVFLIDLQLYPALLMTYVAGVVGIAVNNYDVINAVLDVGVYNYNIDQKMPLIMTANSTLLGTGANVLLELDNRKTPLSDHFHDLIYENLPKELFFGKNFDDIFDHWEVLLAMKYADVNITREASYKSWVPGGRYLWRERLTSQGTLSDMKDMASDDKWPALKTGMFGGSLSRSIAAYDVVEEFAKQARWF